MNRKLIAILVAVAALLCTACAFFPEEEVLPDTPVLYSQTKQYTLIPVERGDLVLTAEAKCTYQAAVQEDVYFSIDGEVISQFFVQEGDVVTAGTLLAELESTAYHSQIEASQETLDLLELQIAQTNEKLGLYYERCSLLDDAAAADPSYSYQSEAADRTCLRLYDELEFLKKELAVEQMAMDKLRQELAQRQIVAPMDGTVTYALNLNPNVERHSYAKQKACTVSDVSTSRFVAELDPGMVKKGDDVVIVINDIACDAKVTNVESSGVDEDIVIASMQLTADNIGLADSTTGTLMVTLGERKDVLYVPEASVNTLADGTKIVYYLDENGVRYAKTVETGLEAEGMIEIVSGLEEGELVVK